MEIAGHDAKWFSQAQILDKIRTSSNTLDLKVITPMIYQKPVRIIKSRDKKNVMQSKMIKTCSSGIFHSGARWK